MHLSNYVISYLKFFKNFSVYIMSIEAICHLTTTPGIIPFTSLPLCVLCSSNAKLLAVPSNMLFSLPWGLPYIFYLGKTYYLFSHSFKCHLINVPWLFKALPESNYMIDLTVMGNVDRLFWAGSFRWHILIITVIFVLCQCRNKF